jgi:hypothetical protein
MKVTAIIKNVNNYFFDGFGDSIQGLNNMNDIEKLNYLMNKGISNPETVTTKVGNGSFSDRITLNKLRNQTFSVSYKLENRKGYKLATFEVL